MRFNQLLEAMPMAYIPLTMMSMIQKAASECEWDIVDIGRGNLAGEGTATAVHVQLQKQVGEELLQVTSEYVNSIKNGTVRVTISDTPLASASFKGNDFDSYIVALRATMMKAEALRR